MESINFRGKILFFARDHLNNIQLYKKQSKGVVTLEQYIEYIQLLEKQLGHRLIKSFVMNQDDKKRKYIWCSKVWRTDLNERISPNHQKYITFLEEKRKDVIFIGPYKSMRTRGLHLCNYGHEWLIQPIKVKNGETCPKCKKKFRESKGAKYITELLVQNEIEFIKEVSLTHFGHKDDLRLDFLICQNNHPLFVIEFNGIQHYKALKSKFFSGYKGWKERRLRDWKKRNHCWKIGLPVVDIPYTETEEQIQETIYYFLNLFELINDPSTEG